MRPTSNKNDGDLRRRTSCVSSNMDSDQMFASSSEYFIILEEEYPIEANLIKEFYRNTKNRKFTNIEGGSHFESKMFGLSVSGEGEHNEEKSDWSKLV